METEFNSLLDLYKKLYPALTTKKNEIKKTGREYIREEDIWNSLKESKWKSSSNLTLSEMVNDILECNVEVLDLYIKKQISKIDRKVNLESTESLF